MVAVNILKKIFSCGVFSSMKPFNGFKDEAPERAHKGVIMSISIHGVVQWDETNASYDSPPFYSELQSLHQILIESVYSSTWQTRVPRSTSKDKIKAISDPGTKTTLAEPRRVSCSVLQHMVSRPPRPPFARPFVFLCQTRNTGNTWVYSWIAGSVSLAGLLQLFLFCIRRRRIRDPLVGLGRRGRRMTLGGQLDQPAQSGLIWFA